MATGTIKYMNDTNVVSTTTTTTSYGDITFKKLSNGMKLISFDLSTFPSSAGTLTTNIPSGYAPLAEQYLLGISGSNGVRGISFTGSSIVVYANGSQTGIYCHSLYA